LVIKIILLKDDNKISLLIQEVLFEMICRQFKNKESLFKINLTHKLFNEYSSQKMGIFVLKYLLDSYTRAQIQIGKRIKNDYDNTNRILIEAKSQIVNYIILLLTRFNRPVSMVKSLLVPFMFENQITKELLVDLISKNDNIDALFSPILNNLSFIAQKSSLMDEEFHQTIGAMRELCDIKINNTRPICDLAIRLKNWLPIRVNGKLLSETSLMGPFCRFSCMPDEDIRIVENYFKHGDLSVEQLKIISDNIRPKLQSLRVND
jgi:hypothetical protein